MPLSCYIIAKNEEERIQNVISSVIDLADEVIIIDDGSTDNTAPLATAAGANVFSFPNPSEGEKRVFGVEHCKFDWILCLDADEEIPAQLTQEIRQTIKKPGADAYLIPFQNHFLGRPLYHGGEDYSQLRLFRKSKTEVEVTPVHAFHKLKKGHPGELKHKLTHYSYRSIGQLYRKFTDYARREALRKLKAGEKASLKKLIMYPAHMFWARYFKDKGYKDGLFRIPLDVGFAYMEFMTYWFMLKRKSAES